MRHRKHNVRFGRQKSHYKATMRHLVSGLVINKSIITTKVKAKETSRLADKLVTMAKANDLAGRRNAYSLLQDRDLVAILFNDIAPLFKERKGGYTRVMLTGKRKGDNAQMAILEFVEKPKAKVVTAKKKEEKKKEALSQPKAESQATERAEKKEEPKEEKPQKKQAPDIKKEDLKKIIQRPIRNKSEKSGFLKRFFKHKKGQ